MRIFFISLILSSIISGSANAQDDGYGLEEVIVTGSRMAEYRPDVIPAVTLAKRADFMIQKVRIISDTRKADLRREEIYQTIKNLLKKAKDSKMFSLGTGEDYFVPLTENNYRLSLSNHRRKPDTSMTYLLVKAPLDQEASANDISASIKAFIKDAKVVGRTEVLPEGKLGLSIVRPEKYRQELIHKIAADAKAASAAFGKDYRVLLKGMESPLLWERQGLATMALYIPYSYDIVPAGH